MNSLCLTGKVWNKFCRKTVVPVYMRNVQNWIMLCYSPSCSHGTTPLTSLAQLVLFLIRPSLSYSRRVPTLAELWHVVTQRSLHIGAKIQHKYLTIGTHAGHVIYMESAVHAYHNAHRELRASPRKPKVATPTSRSEKSLILEV